MYVFNPVEDIQAALDFAKAEQLNVLVLSGGSSMLLPGANTCFSDAHGYSRD